MLASGYRSERGLGGTTTEVHDGRATPAKRFAWGGVAMEQKCDGYAPREVKLI